MGDIGAKDYTSLPIPVMDSGSEVKLLAVSLG